MRSWALLLACTLLMGCGRRPLEEAELPSSHRNSTLADYQPPDLLTHLAEWYPGDWRVHLLRGLTDSTREGRLASLQRADSLHPTDPLPAYWLAVTWLDSSAADGERRAVPYVEKALALDPENGVLKVMLAYALLKAGNVPRARALFMDSRRVPSGTFYLDRLEQVILGLFSHTRQLNPYTLTEAVALYRSVPLPPFEKMIDVLYSVYLSPLEDRPYDIRIRGRDAARSVFLLGRQLRVASYGNRQVFSNGYEQRAMGFMFQLRAAEFLTLFHEAFDDIALTERAFNEVVSVQAEYHHFMGSDAWKDSAVTGYLDRWSALIREQPGISVAQAVEEARPWTLWRRLHTYRYPTRDDRP